MAETDPTTRRSFDRFGLLFIVTVVTVGLLLLIDLDRETGLAEVLAVAVTVLTAATLLLAVAAAGIGRRGFRFAWIAAGLTVAASIGAALTRQPGVNQGGLLWLILVFAAPVIALRRLMHHSEVTGETVLGAISVYLLIALAATYLFLFIDTSFGGSDRFFGEPEPTTVFAYFSLVTIATLGYGDFAPVAVAGRAAAVWEAVIGQIYLVVVVARIVTLYSGHNRHISDSLSGDDD
ncbi:MAG: ion channel [Acidimicrobiia bacterium]|nr:ion channel [Acidimicrobiia bacterium]